MNQQQNDLKNWKINRIEWLRLFLKLAYILQTLNRV